MASKAHHLIKTIMKEIIINKEGEFKELNCLHCVGDK